MDGAKEIKLKKSLKTNFLFNCPTTVSAVLRGRRSKEKDKEIHAQAIQVLPNGVQHWCFITSVGRFNSGSLPQYCSKQTDFEKLCLAGFEKHTL